MSFQKIYGDHSTTNYKPSPPDNDSQEIRTPRMDVYESDTRYYLRMSLPGVRSKNLLLQFFKENHLEIKGYVRPEPPEEFKNLITQEVFEGPFYRLIRFPVQVNENSIQFEYNGGILEIYIEKSLHEGGS